MASKPRIIDVARRGVPFTDPARNAQVIQEAIDELGDTLPGGAYGHVLLPDDSVPIFPNIFPDRDRVGLEGHGKGVSALVATSGHDILSLVRRRPLAANGYIPPPSADHFPKGIHGRIGFRTKAVCHLATQGGPLDTFPSGVKALTVDLALDLTHLNDPGGTYARGKSASLCGLTAGNAMSSPWEMVLANDSYVFRMQSASGVIVQTSFGLIGRTPGVVRLTVQVDLAARSLLTWIDDHRVPNDATIPADFVEFAANQHAPFGIGSNSLNANAVSDWFGGASDITFLGLRVSHAAIYRPSVTLERPDRNPVDDSRYFAVESSTAGLLTLQDLPSAVADSRIMTVTGPGYAATTAYLLDNVGHQSNYATTIPGPIRNLSLVSGSRFGRGIAVGYALFLRVEGCEVAGGRDGIGSINFGSTYPATILDCDLSGADSPLYLFGGSNVVIDRIYIPGGFRCGFRLVNSGATIRNVFAPCWGTQDHYVRAVRSFFVLEDSAFDNEGNQGAQVAPIYVMSGGVFPIICRVNRCAFATYGAHAPLALLEDVANPADFPHPMRFGMSDCVDVIRGGGVIQAADRWEVTKDW
jgi:hypothetical protein